MIASFSSSKALNKILFKGSKRFWSLVSLKFQSFSRFLHKIIICKISIMPIFKVAYFVLINNIAFIFTVNNLIVRQVGKKLSWPSLKDTSCITWQSKSIIARCFSYTANKIVVTIIFRIFFYSCGSFC